MRHLICVGMSLAVLLLGTVANAGLVLRGVDTMGNNLIYDSDRNLTWYDFSNPSSSWQDQTDWADALSIDFGGTILANWMLPSTVDDLSSLGFDMTSSDLGQRYLQRVGNEQHSDHLSVAIQRG